MITLVIAAFVFSLALVGGVVLLISLYGGRQRTTGVTWQASAPVCIPGRANCLTGAYSEDLPAYGQGDWKPDVVATGPIVREVSSATPYRAGAAGGKHAPKVATHEGEEWKYPVVMPEPAIRVDNWPAKKETK